MHVIARFRGDAAWPEPVWNVAPPQDYESAARDGSLQPSVEPDADADCRGPVSATHSPGASGPFQSTKPGRYDQTMKMLQRQRDPDRPHRERRSTAMFRRDTPEEAEFRTEVADLARGQSSDVRCATARRARRPRN